MLTPTHIQVAVFHTKDLIIKGKNGTNDPFIVFSLGKQKFASSVKEKISSSLVEWNEGCDIPIPSSQGNKAELVLKVMHKASLGENFIGRISIPLSDFDVTAKQKPKWYPLKPRPGKEKDTKYRGEIEVKVTFLIKSNTESTNDLASNSKRRDSLRSSLGSILSLGKKKSKKEDKKGSSKDSLNSSVDSLRNVNSSRLNLSNNMPIINDDPGVISEGEEDEDQGIVMKSRTDLDKDKKVPSVHSSSSTSVISGSFPERLNSASLPTTPRTRSGFRGIFSSNNSIDENDFDGSVLAIPKPRTVRLPSVIVEEPPAITVTAPSTPQPPSKLPASMSMSNLMDVGRTSGKGSIKKSFRAMFNSSKHMSVDEINFNSANDPSNLQSPSMKRAPSIRDLKIPKETYKMYERKPKEELIAMILNLQGTVHTQKQKISDLEDYIDKLLLRVIDNMPVLLKKTNSIKGNS